MRGGENHLYVAVGLESILDDHRSDTPDLTLESIIPARRLSPRPSERVDSANRRHAGPQIDELPLRIAERLQTCKVGVAPNRVRARGGAGSGPQGRRSHQSTKEKRTGESAGGCPVSQR